MTIGTKELPYAKETGDVAVLLVNVVSSIKAKGDYMALIPQLVAAVDGAPQIDDEAAESKKVVAATLGYHLGELVEAITAKKA
jgi:hypothetical protein